MKNNVNSYVLYQMIVFPMKNSIFMRPAYAERNAPEKCNQTFKNDHFRIQKVEDLKTKLRQLIQQNKRLQTEIESVKESKN